MPELFGNTYILPAIIVVVLLLLLLLVGMTRRRRSAAPAPTKSAERPTTPSPQPAPMLTQRPVPMQAPMLTQRSEPMQATSPAPAQATPATEVPMAAASPSAEMPMVASVTASAPIAAAEALAVTSLTRLQRGPVPLDDPLHSVIMDILQGWGDLASEDAKRLDVFRPEKILAETENIVLPKDHKAGEHARLRLARIRNHATDLQLKARAVVADDGPAAEALADATAAEPTETAEPGEAIAPEQAAGVVDEPTAAPLLVEAGESSFWEDEEEGWEVSEPRPPEEIPAWPDEEASAGEAQTEKPWEADTLVDRDHTPRDEDSLSSLHLKVRTAEDLLALPAGQRVDMLVFLEPAQLSQVFEATDDLDLKKGVIDTLEHVGNPSALGVLRRCLDDPSPEVQLYALEAADRMLGVE